MSPYSEPSARHLPGGVFVAMRRGDAACGPGLGEHQQVAHGVMRMLRAWGGRRACRAVGGSKFPAVCLRCDGRGSSIVDFQTMLRQKRAVGSPPSLARLLLATPFVAQGSRGQPLLTRQTQLLGRKYVILTSMGAAHIPGVQHRWDQVDTGWYMNNPRSSCARRIARASRPTTRMWCCFGNPLAAQPGALARMYRPTLFCSAPGRNR